MGILSIPGREGGGRSDEGEELPPGWEEDEPAGQDRALRELEGRPEVALRGYGKLVSAWWAW